MAQAIAPASGGGWEIAFDGAWTAEHICRVRIIFFAQSREAAGCGETRLEVREPIAAGELWDRLLERFSGLAPLRRSSRLARRETYLEPGEMLEPDDEIAVIPPVSGG